MVLLPSSDEFFTRSMVDLLFGREFSFLSVVHTRIASSAARHPSEASWRLISKYCFLNGPHPSRSRERNGVVPSSPVGLSLRNVLQSSSLNCGSLISKVFARSSTPRRYREKQA